MNCGDNLTEKMLAKRKEVSDKVNEIIKLYNIERRTGEATIVFNFSEGNITASTVSHKTAFVK